MLTASRFSFGSVAASSKAPASLLGCQNRFQGWAKSDRLNVTEEIRVNNKVLGASEGKSKEDHEGGKHVQTIHLCPPLTLQL